MFTTRSGVTWVTVLVPWLATQTLPLLSRVRPTGLDPVAKATDLNRLAAEWTARGGALKPRAALATEAAGVPLTPGGVNLTIWLLAASVNQRVPSGLATMPWGVGCTPPVGTGIDHSSRAPPGVIWAIWPTAVSVNQRLPSTAPRAMPWGPAAGVASGKATAAPLGVIRPMALPPWRVYQTAPSGPVVMPVGLLPRAAYSLMVLPSRVITPMLAVACSVNHMRPSGPAVMPVGMQAVLLRLMAEGTCVSAGMVPIWPADWLVNQMLPSGPVAMPVGVDCGARVTAVVWPTTAVTVRVAAWLGVAPRLLEARSLNRALLSLTVGAPTVQVTPVAPVTGDQVWPASSERCHCRAGWGRPLAVAVNVAGLPADTDVLAGWVLITGANTFGGACSVVLLLVPQPRPPVRSDRPATSSRGDPRGANLFDMGFSSG